MPGRGRGRHLPINYPDGLTCKLAPTDPYARLDPEAIPAPPPVAVADKELIALRRNLHAMPVAAAFRVQGAQPPRAVIRYSDRYQDAPIVPFDKSGELTMKRNVHFPEELQPPKKRKDAAAASSSDQPAAAPKFKRLKKGGDVNALLDRMAKNEDDEPAEGSGAAASSAAVIDDDDEEEEEDEGKNAEKKNDDDDEAEESDEDEDLFEEEDYGGFGSENDDMDASSTPTLIFTRSTGANRREAAPRIIDEH